MEETIDILNNSVGGCHYNTRLNGIVELQQVFIENRQVMW